MSDPTNVHTFSIYGSPWHVKLLRDYSGDLRAANKTFWSDNHIVLPNGTDEADLRNPKLVLKTFVDNSTRYVPQFDRDQQKFTQDVFEGAGNPAVHSAEISHFLVTCVSVDGTSKSRQINLQSGNDLPGPPRD